MILVGCSQNIVDKNSNALKIEAEALFKKATEEIILLASEDPAGVLKGIVNDVEIIYDITDINGQKYYKTNSHFEDVRSYYANIFTGDALEWILSTKFIDVEGTLYCSPTGGATGWVISEIEVEVLEQNDNTYLCEATFYVQDIKDTSRFIIEKNENTYRISDIDYVPNSLK